jgi:hypothetical protein
MRAGCWQQVCPEASIPFADLDARYGGDGARRPGLPAAYVKPVKAAFSVLARRVDNQRRVHRHTRFGRRELWVIRRLVEPFERIARARLPQAGTRPPAAAGSSRCRPRSTTSTAGSTRAGPTRWAWWTP